MQLVGQIKNLEIIEKWDKIPNFIIIQGDANTGKTYMTKYICAKFKMTYVYVDNSINSVRCLISNMSEGANVLYHFKDFDKASVQAKNALLKITEETPKGNTIVITGGSQLATLESRAKKIIMNPYTKEDMIIYMSKYFKENKVLDYYKAGFNTPSKVLKYKDFENIDNLLDYAYNIFEHLSVLNIDTVIYLTHRFENNYADIDPTLIFLNMLINIINYKSKYELQYRYSFQNVLDNLIECKNKLIKNNNLNRKMLLYRTFYNIMLLKGDL